MEMLMTQGFPVKLELTCKVACCSFAQRIKDGVERSYWPSRSSICKMAGNSMHTNVSGVVLLYCLTQVQLDNYVARLLQHARKLEKCPLVVLTDAKRRRTGDLGDHSSAHASKPQSHRYW